MRPFRGARNHPSHSPHYQCALVARAAPDINASTASTASTALSQRDRFLIGQADAGAVCTSTAVSIGRASETATRQVFSASREI